jgi:hypothetical protein
MHLDLYQGGRKPFGRPRYYRAALILLLALLPSRSLAAPPAKEYDVKAVFLFNFAQFVEWPDSAFASKDSPLVLGVLGNDPFGASLDEAVRDKLVDRRPMEVRRFRSVEEAKDCNILFVSSSEMTRLSSVLEAVKAHDVLTVGETDEFAREGGMICFVNRDGRIRLRVNLKAVQAAKLTVSSKLLRVAEIVSDEGG